MYANVISNCQFHNKMAIKDLMKLISYAVLDLSMHLKLTFLRVSNGGLQIKGFYFCILKSINSAYTLHCKSVPKITFF